MRRRAGWGRVAGWFLLAAAGTGAGAWWWSTSHRAPPARPTVEATRDRVVRLFDAALQAVEQDDRDTVKQSLDELRELPGTAEHINLLLGVTLACSGDTELGLARISKVPPQGNLRRPMLKWTAECFARLGRYADAEQVLKVLITEDPANPEWHRRIARIYHQLGAMDFAMAALRETSRLDPDDYWAYRMSGLIHSADYANYSAAVEQYRLALEHAPPEGEERAIRTELAQCLIEQRDYAAAMEVLEPVPTAARILVMRSECLWSMGDLDEARDLLKQAEELNGENAQIRVLKARMLLDDGQREQAIEILLGILEREPHDFQSRYQLALAYQALGDNEAYERELARYRESETLRSELFEMFRDAMKDPADSAIRDRIAERCERLGQTSLAKTWKTAADNARRLSGEVTDEQPAP